MKIDPIPDDEVIERVLAGDTALFEILMTRYSQRLYRVIRSILADDDETRDVMQEAFVRAYTHLGQYKGTARFSSWLAKIAVRESLARLKVRRKFVDIDAISETTEQTATMASNTQSQEEEILTHTLAMVLESALDALPQSYRSVFMLRDVEGMTTAETAECLGITTQTVRVRLHRARSALRKQIFAKTGSATASAFRFLGERCESLGSAVLGAISAMKKG